MDLFVKIKDTNNYKHILLTDIKEYINKKMNEKQTNFNEQIFNIISSDSSSDSDLYYHSKKDNSNIFSESSL